MPFGITVSLVEPGFTKTGLAANAKTAEKTLADYAARRTQVSMAVQRSISNGAPPRSVAEAVYDALTSDAPRLRHRVGASTHIVIALKWLLPDDEFRWVIRRVFQMRQTRVLVQGSDSRTLTS